MLLFSVICGCIIRWLVTNVSEEFITFIFRTMYELLACFTAGPFVPDEKSFWYYLVGPKAVLDAVCTRKIPFLVGINPDIPAVSLIITELFPLS